MNRGIVYMDCTIRLYSSKNMAVEVNKDNVDIIQMSGYTIIKNKE